MQDYNFNSITSTDKLTDWENEPDIKVLKEDFNSAQEYQRSFITEIDKWKDIKNITGHAKPPVVKNKSQVQPKTVRKHLEWRYPSLSEPFVQTENLFSILPHTFEDMLSARQNELVINYQFNNQIDKISFIDEFIRRNVDEGIAIVKTFWERKVKKVMEEVNVFTYEQVTLQEDLDFLNQYISLKETNYNEFKNLPEDLQESVLYTIENNIPVKATISGTTEQEIEKVIKNQPRLDIIDPRNCYIDPSCGSDYTKASFIIISALTSKAELLEDGRYKNIDKIDFDCNYDSNDDHYTTTPRDFNFKDEPRKKVVVYEYWGYYDIHGTEELTPILVSWVGNTIIRMEENVFPQGKLPFIFSKYIPVLDSVYGESDIALLEDSQKITGSVTRSIVDLMAKIASTQRGIKKQFLDPVNYQRFQDGMNYEFNPNEIPQNAIYDHSFPDIPQSLFLWLQKQQEEAESITGIKAFNSGLNGDVFGKTAAGTRGILNASAQREKSILRRLIKAITDIGKNVTAMNAEFLSEEATIRITNKKFEKVRREDLGGNFDLSVNINDPEMSEKMASDLSFLLQTLGASVPFEITQTVLAYIVKLKNLPELEQKIKDIKNEPSEEDKQLKQMELLKVQLEIDKLKSEIKMNEAKALLIESQAQGEIIDNEKEATGVKHQEEIEHIKAQSKGNQNLEITKALVKNDPNITNDQISSAIGYNSISD